MKTVLTEIAECLEKDIKFITKDDDKSDRYYQAGMMYALTLVRDGFNKQKQQHEQTAIHITNVLMDALDNPKGGKFSMEDEFNKYWEDKYTTNKETLK